MENEEVRELAEKYALQNAVKYESDAETGSVMGKLMGEHPELRERGDEVAGVVNEAVRSVNSLSVEERKNRLDEIAPELIEELEEDEAEEDKGLPELPNVGEEVVMRFAPNPNGPPTLGSARGMVVNDEYVKEYDGRFILRFDDTDPVNKRPVPEAYDWFTEDAEWLGIDIHDVYRASDRVETYYEYAERLIERGGAYVCHCGQDEFSELKNEGQACPHRNRPVEENLEEWNKMVSGEYDEGEAVLRVKTDIEHKNPALRDWVALRIVKTPHPLAGDRYNVWPMLDFQSGIDDHLTGVTHIIRGKDLRNSAGRQKFVYDYFGWEYPETIHWGRVSIEEYGTLSTSSLSQAIEDGKYEGWDDPRVPTVRALRRRGIQPQAIRDALLDLGVSEADINFSMDHVYSKNRKIVDDTANRYFLVRDPVEVSIEDAEPKTARVPLHPDDEERGFRYLDVDDRIVIEPRDVPEVGERVRLKDLYNVEITSKDPVRAEYIGNDLSLVRDEGVDVVHWLPPDALGARLRTPSGDETGLVEGGVRDEEDNIVQFERVGFARVENVEDEITAIFSHR
ncbi:MAG: glutamate--tRNA ligase [Halobacteria archaeon]|nr:glutamate--tRNA ligase [Halobacteria archaeon]